MDLSDDDRRAAAPPPPSTDSKRSQPPPPPPPPPAMIDLTADAKESKEPIVLSDCDSDSGDTVALADTSKPDCRLCYRFTTRRIDRRASEAGLDCDSDGLVPAIQESLRFYRDPNPDATDGTTAESRKKGIRDACRAALAAYLAMHGAEDYLRRLIDDGFKVDRNELDVVASHQAAFMKLCDALPELVLISNSGCPGAH